MDPAGLPPPHDESGRRRPGGARRAIATVRLSTVAVLLGLALPAAGLFFLLRPDYAAVHWTSPSLHFVFFLVVGFTAASLALVTGEAAPLLPTPRLRVKGKADEVDAYLLQPAGSHDDALPREDPP